MSQVSMLKSGSSLIFVALLLISALMVPRSAHAIVPCTPPLCASEYTQLMNNIQLVTQYTKQVEQYRQQIEQYKTQLDQYKQMYVTGSTYKPAPAYRENIDERFPERGLNDGMVETCGSSPKNNPVGQQQYGYCVTIVQTQNRRYNAMRAILQDVEKNDKDLEAARVERASIAKADQGALQANTNKVASIQSKMQNDIQNARYMMDAYDAVLKTLNEDMVRTANAALKNKNNLLGTAVQGAALKLALQAARQRDR